jgi:RNA-binding protein
MKNLTNSQTRYLRQLAHKLKPVVMIGEKGLTENVLSEVNLALESHELIKVKIRAEEKEDRQEILESLLQQAQATKVQTIGHIVCLFKVNPKKPKIQLPK